MLVETEVLKRLNKTNRPIFTRFYGSYEDEEYLYLLLEYVNGGELSEYLNQQSKLAFNDTFIMANIIFSSNKNEGLTFLEIISKDQIRQFSAEIIDILECMHSCGVIHRDLKV